MLIAENHGKYVLEARNFEDYLTSAVFGHLRYVRPGPFWAAVFGIAACKPVESSLITAAQLIERGIGQPVDFFECLDVIFWPEHTQGVPDLVLHFRDRNLRPLVIVVEAKLSATKSGVGEDDQLARYMRILDSLECLRPPLPPDALSFVLYLTATDSRSEILDSLQQYGGSEESHRRLFHLQWQDLIHAIDQTAHTSDFEALILGDVRTFLVCRGLEYFSGMGSAATIPAVLESDGDFLKDEPLFDFNSIPDGQSLISERWMDANGSR